VLIAGPQNNITQQQEVVVLSDSDDEAPPSRPAGPVARSAPDLDAAAAATNATTMEAIEIEDEAVAQLVDMGFTPEQATKARMFSIVC
jgi:hypothetical protein